MAEDAFRPWWLRLSGMWLRSLPTLAVPGDLFKTVKEAPVQTTAEIKLDEERKLERLRYFKEILDHSGIKLSGRVLELASGVASLGYLCDHLVATDGSDAKVRLLRSHRLEARVARLEALPFKKKSFDYVVSIAPQLRTRVISAPHGAVQFVFDREYSRRLVEAALRIARQKIVIASFDIALHPPFPEKVEKREATSLYYVVYRANGQGRQ